MPSFSPVTSNKLYIQIYNQIRDAILAGTFQVGDKLPSEKELCETFGVSRVPVREALCALELNGLVSSNQGQGVYVKEVNSVTNDWIQEIDPQDIIQARKLMEPEVARCAALNISEAEKARMKSIIERFRQEAEAGKCSLFLDAFGIAQLTAQHLIPAADAEDRCAALCQGEDCLSKAALSQPREIVHGVLCAGQDQHVRLAQFVI